MASLIKAAGGVSTVTPAGGKKKFKLAELQHYVGGYIEIIHVPGAHVQMVVNEEGRLKGLALNKTASEITQRPIVGDVLLVMPGEM